MQALASVLVAGKWHGVEVGGCRLQVVPSVASSPAKCLSFQEFIETGFLDIDAELTKTVPSLPAVPPKAEQLCAPAGVALDGQLALASGGLAAAEGKAGADAPPPVADQALAAEQAGEAAAPPGEASAPPQAGELLNAPAAGAPAPGSPDSTKGDGAQQRRVELAELAAASDLRLQSFTRSLEELPVEDAAKMTGLASLQALVGNAKQAKTEAALESLADEIGAACTQANQLIKCLQKGTRDRAYVQSAPHSRHACQSSGLLC